MMNGFRIDEHRKEQLQELINRMGLQAREELWPVLNRAFLHRSFRSENNLEEDNERLEFLGDSVIGVVATEYLLERLPEEDEGELSKLRAAMVSRIVLGKIAQEMEIGELMLLGQGEDQTGGRRRSSILGSALEAVCGAIYLAYPWNITRDSIRRTVILPAWGFAEKKTVADFKSRLQEWSQKYYQEVPEYQLVDVTGPDHKRIFKVEVSLGGEVQGSGTGARIKSAENEAAKAALQKKAEEKNRKVKS